MVGVRKVTVTSFRRSHDVLLHSVPRPCGRPPLTHASTGDSWTLMGESAQFLVGSLLLSPGSWCAQVLFVPSKSLFPQSCVSSGVSMVGLMVNKPKRAYSIHRSAAPRAPVEGHC